MFAVVRGALHKGAKPGMSLAAPARAPSENLRGIVAMLAATAVFVVNDTLLKIATEALPTGEAIFLRGVFTTLYCASLVKNRESCSRDNE